LGKAFDQTGEAPGAKQAAHGAVDHGVHGGGHDGGPGLQDAVSEGVRLGYSVIEDQIRQAQVFASKLNPGSRDFSGGGGGDEIRSLLNRLLRTYGDLTNVWLEVLTAALGNADIVNAILGKERAKPDEPLREQGADSGPGPVNGPASGIGAISFNIIANGPVETDIKLFAGSDASTSLVVQDLRSRENGAPPLDDIDLIQAGSGEPMRFVIKVPNEQPPGLYQGLILDQRTDAPVGALGVTVGST
ncbi:MAG: hypothetical protein ACR2Q4_08590, partial [Geminicoccaceae bacterium]